MNFDIKLNCVFKEFLKQPNSFVPGKSDEVVNEEAWEASDDLLFTASNAQAKLTKLNQNHSVLKKAYKEAEQYFKDNQEEFNV